MTQASTLRAIIDTWKINRALLASKVGISKGAFNNKLNEINNYRFTDKELNALCNVLIQLRETLGIVDGADFNEALKIIANSKKNKHLPNDWEEMFTE